jgi:hypothetical protein
MRTAAAPGCVCGSYISKQDCELVLHRLSSPALVQYFLHQLVWSSSDTWRLCLKNISDRACAHFWQRGRCQEAAITTDPTTTVIPGLTPQCERPTLEIANVLKSYRRARSKAKRPLQKSRWSIPEDALGHSASD